MGDGNGSVWFAGQEQTSGYIRGYRPYDSASSCDRGIHMDGFLDTTDARRSYQEPEKKLAILKDPHTGAFALIGLGVYLLWSVAVWSVADRAVLPGMACAFVLSRTLSGLSVTLCKGAKRTDWRRLFINPPGNGQYAFPPYAILSGARVSYV